MKTKIVVTEGGDEIWTINYDKFNDETDIVVPRELVLEILRLQKGLEELRHENYLRDTGWDKMLQDKLKEIDRLKGEIENLRQWRQKFEDGHSELRSQNARLKEALGKIAERKVEEPDYDWSDWNGGDAASEVRKIISEFAKSQLSNQGDVR